MPLVSGSGSAMLALAYMNGDEVKLERFTINFPTVDFDTVLDLLEAEMRS